jgi:hypothetical protein
MSLSSGSDDDCNTHIIIPVELRGKFSTRVEIVDIVATYVATKQGKSTRIDKKKSGCKNVVIGCSDRLGKNSNGVCNFRVNISRLKDGMWKISQKQFNLEHMNCNAVQKLSARALCKCEEVAIAVNSNANITAKTLNNEIIGHLGN